LAGEKVDSRLDTSPSPKLDIEHVNGHAEILGWDKSEVHVTGELGEYTDEFVFEKRGNVVVIHVEVKQYGDKWWKNKGDGDDLTIYVPHGSDINYTAVNADVEIADINQSVAVEVVNGDVTLHNVGKRIKVESVNGDITLKDVLGRLNVETVNGDITAVHEGQEAVSFVSVNGSIDAVTSSPVVSVETVNGAMDLALQRIDSLDVSTVNGSTDASMHLNDNGKVRASSVGGKITLNFQSNVSAQFDIETHAGGNIVNKITQDKVNKPKYGPSKWLRFINNGGSASVDVSTVHGKIEVSQK